MCAHNLLTYILCFWYIDCTQSVPNRVLSATLYMSILQSLIVYTCIPGTYIILCFIPLYIGASVVVVSVGVSVTSHVLLLTLYHHLTECNSACCILVASFTSLSRFLFFCLHSVKHGSERMLKKRKGLGSFIM